MGNIARLGARMPDEARVWQSMVDEYDQFYAENILSILQEDQGTLLVLYEKRKQLDNFLEECAIMEIASAAQAAALLDIALTAPIHEDSPRYRVIRHVGDYLRLQ